MPYNIRRIIPFFLAVVLMLTVGTEKGHTQMVDIDSAIQNAATSLSVNIGQGSRIAILAMHSDSVPMSNYVINEMIAAFVNMQGFTVVDRAQLDLLMAEMEFQMSGYVDDHTAQSLGRILGVGFIITGTFEPFVANYRLTARVIEVQTAAIRGVFSSNVQNDATVAFLMRQARFDAGPAGEDGRVAQTAPGGRAAASSVFQVGSIGPAGGIIFFDKGVFSDGWRFLEVAPASTEFTAPWGARRQDVAGTQEGIGTGRRNTELIVEHLRRNRETGRAAQMAAALNFGGFDDWFLPSRDELNLMFQNRAIIGDLGNRWYWSSSQSYHRNDAWRQNFDISGSDFAFGFFGNRSGEQHRNDKDNANSVRAIRAF